jgi:hypothetical protein
MPSQDFSRDPDFDFPIYPEAFFCPPKVEVDTKKARQ